MQLHFVSEYLLDPLHDTHLHDVVLFRAKLRKAHNNVPSVPVVCTFAEVGRATGREELFEFRAVPNSNHVVICP